jgi:O-antigen ligase
MDALTADPNHLGIILDVPLLALVPIYLKLERGHRLRVPIAVLLAFFLLVELATLSRSGILGLAVGFVALALVYGRRLIASRQILVPLGAVALIGLALVSRRQHFFETVLSSRLQRSYSSTGVHFQVYSFIPKILHMHPLFGLGFNNFAVYYEFVTGKKNWGPHSFYVATLVETGLVGTLLFAVFLVYLFRRLAVSLRLGRALAAAGDYDARLVRPFAWGLVAALLATMAANAFYLTMTFFYFYALVLLVLAVPVVFARRVAAAAPQ